MFKVNNKGDVVLVSLLLTWNISHVILVFLLLDSDRWIPTRLFLSDVFDPKLLRLNFRARGEYVTTQFWWKTADFWSRVFALVDPKKWSANSKSGKALRWKWLIDPKNVECVNTLKVGILVITTGDPCLLHQQVVLVNYPT